MRKLTFVVLSSLAISIAGLSADRPVSEIRTGQPTSQNRVEGWPQWRVPRQAMHARFRSAITRRIAATSVAPIAPLWALPASLRCLVLAPQSLDGSP